MNNESTIVYSPVCYPPTVHEMFHFSISFLQENVIVNTVQLTHVNFLRSVVVSASHEITHAFYDFSLLLKFTLQEISPPLRVNYFLFIIMTGMVPIKC